jgi:beta-phosphoglucomutase-like phosphatase (HAD superfamily)
VIAPAVAFVEVFKNKGVPISMTEARQPMGLRKDLHIEVSAHYHHVLARPSHVMQIMSDLLPTNESCFFSFL